MNPLARVNVSTKVISVAPIRLIVFVNDHYKRRQHTTETCDRNILKFVPQSVSRDGHLVTLKKKIHAHGREMCD